MLIYDKHVLLERAALGHGVAHHGVMCRRIDPAVLCRKGQRGPSQPADFAGRKILERPARIGGGPQRRQTWIGRVQRVHDTNRYNPLMAVRIIVDCPGGHVYAEVSWQGRLARKSAALS